MGWKRKKVVPTLFESTGWKPRVTFLVVLKRVKAGQIFRVTRTCDSRDEALEITEEYFSKGWYEAWIHEKVG